MVEKVRRLKEYKTSSLVEYRNKPLKVKQIEYSHLEGDVDLKKPKLNPSVLAVARKDNAVYLVFRV